MGTIVTRKRRDQSFGYTAQIVIKRKGHKPHREAKTFDRQQAARAWIAKREAELAAPGALDPAPTEQPTLAEAIDRYVRDTRREIGRTKAQVLEAIKGCPIGALPVDRIGSREIVALASDLAAVRQPQTVANYLSHLAAVFAIARPAWGYALDQQAMRDALAVARRLGLTAKSSERDRRPTLDELDALLTHFAQVRDRRPTSVPMTAIVPFAIFSTRRQEEITRIAWADLDEPGARIMVRDMKNPGEKIGNNVWCDLPEPALRIIQAAPRSGDLIFPYTTDAIGAAFTRACKLLAIDDLRFHDLRHDGVSRLFEMGMNIPNVAAVSGHRSWTSLKRYTHIRQTGDKYAGWSWLPTGAKDSADTASPQAGRP